MTIGQRIRTARKAKKLSQEELAEILNISRPTVSAWENDVFKPSVNNIMLLSEALGVSNSYLIEEISQQTREGTIKKEPYMYGSSVNSNIIWIPLVSPEINVGKEYFKPAKEEYFPILDEEILKQYGSDNLLGLYAEGDSMEPQISDGDIVIFCKTPEWTPGNIMVVSLCQHLMVKGMVNGPHGQILLRSQNKDYRDIEITKDSCFEIYGKVIKIIRYRKPKSVI